jgi:release factor glutamine methyltransferase
VVDATAALRDGAAALRASESLGPPSGRQARLEALELFEHVMRRPPRSGDSVGASELRRFRRLVARRCEGIPIPYLTGHASFMDLILEVRPGTFIPREWTAGLVEVALRRLRSRSSPVMLDMATGVGPVALGVARALPRARVIGVDIAPSAVALATRNAARLGVGNVRFVMGDLFRPLPPDLMGRVHVVTASPPHIPRDLVRTYRRHMPMFEPEEAFTDFSGSGSKLLGRVATEAPRWLAPKGWLLLEVMSGYARETARLLRRTGFRQVRSIPGRASFIREVVGRT